MRETKLNGNHDRGKPAGREGGYCSSLDGWAKREWTDGVQVDRLQVLDTLSFRTQNSIYEITVLCPGTGEVLVRGGRFFPERTAAFLNGSSLGGSFLKLRGIYPDFKVEFGCGGGRRIITSRVRSIEFSGASDANAS